MQHRDCGLVLAMAVFAATACANKPAKPALISVFSVEGAQPWTHLDARNDPANFQFAIVTDRTGGHRNGVFEDAVRKLNLLQPEFVMSVGDLIEGYTDDEAKINAQWDELEGFVAKLEMPFFYVPGNHDYTNATMARIWKARFGPDRYHFVYKDVLFLCLNSEQTLEAHRRGAILDDQLEWARDILSQHQDVRWTLVFLHQPLWVRENTGRWNDLMALLNARKHTVFAGHLHKYTRYERNGNRYFVLATTGGKSPLRGPTFGEFDHVVWVTMTDDGPIVANLLLEGIWDENVVDESVRKLVSSAFRRPLLFAQPVHLKPGDPRPLALRIKVRNDADVPLRLNAHFAANEFLRPEREQLTAEIPPNSVEELKVVLTPLTNGDWTGFEPLRLDGELRYAIPEHPDVVIPWQQQIGAPQPGSAP